MDSDPAELTSALDKTNVTMAPEQGLSSNIDCEKIKLIANDCGGSSTSLNTLWFDALPNSNTSSWIYQLRKEQLLIACQKFNIDPSGRTVQEIRRLLSEEVRKRKNSASTENLLKTLQDEVQGEESNILYPVPTAPLMPVQTNGTNNIFSTKPKFIEYNNSNNLMSDNTFFRPNNNNLGNIPQETALAKLVKHWNICYSGGTDLYVFLNRVETRARTVQVSLDQLLQALPYFLKDSALRWHEVHGNNLQTWEEFRTRIANFFLPKRYLAQLEANFYSRKQQPREKGRDYILDMLTIIQQHPALRKQDHLDRIFDGLNIDYRLHLNRDRIDSIDDLTTRVNDYEQLRAEEAKVNRHTSHTLSKNYNRSTDCWNCKQSGHIRINCRNTQQLFCSHCGKNNVLSKNCECRKPVVNLNSINDKARYFVNVHIKNEKISALLDTGATLSYTNEKMIPILKKAGFTPIEASNEIQVANQELVKGNFTVKVPITFNNHTTWHELIALPNLAETLILGMDFLCSRGVRLELDGKLLNKTSPEIPGFQPPLHFLIAKTVSIPSLSALTSLDELPTDQQNHVENFIQKQKERFSKITGQCKIGVHSITLKHNQPIKQRYFPRNPAMQSVINKEIDSLLEINRIEPSKSPYSSPIVLVRKKQGTWRMCIDYRQLNNASEPDAYPLPQIQAILDQLREAVFISSIDLKNGYWQIPLDEKSKAYTAFTVPGRGLYQWTVMPFGLHSASATFQRTLDQIIGPDLHPQIFAYLDDIIITGKTFDEHMKNLLLVCNRLYEANMQINFEKSTFVQTKVNYLGHVVSAEGIHTDPAKIEAVEKLPAPTNLKELRRVLGIASWYRRFIQNFSVLVSPLNQLLKKNEKWSWGEEQENSFIALKEKLTSAPVLRCPDFGRPFFLQTDASMQGLGVVLFQRISDNEQVVAYASRTLTPLEKKYSTTEQECLAILWGIRKMRPYLEGYHFTVITDHHSLKWLHTLQNPSGRLARWALEIQQYDFSIEYRKGTSNVVPDALSRSPLPYSEKDTIFSINDLPPQDWVAKKIKEVEINPSKHPDYQIINNRLYKHIKRQNLYTSVSEWKLCIPEQEKPNILSKIHDSTAAGYMGTAKTLHRAQQHYYWPGMYRDIINYVKSCLTCARYKVDQKKPAGLMTTMQCTRPWEIVCADFVGPLPRSSKGNTCLLVIIDKFSRWVELIPVRQATAGCVVAALKDRIIYRFGCPKILLTDNGKQFISKEVEKLTKEHGIEHKFTAPYAPHENPTERTNRIVKTMIAQHCEDNHRKWDTILPEIAFAINTAIREPTGHTAAEINFGYNLVPPCHYKNQTVTPVEKTQTPDMPKLWAKVNSEIKKATERQKHYYDYKRRFWKPKIGDQVLKRDHPISSATKHFAQKLAPKFSGPYVVTDYISSNIINLKDISNNKTYKCHLQDLKLFISNR